MRCFCCCLLIVKILPPQFQPGTHGASAAACRNRQEQQKPHAPLAITREVWGFRQFFSCRCRWGKPRWRQREKRLFTHTHTNWQADQPGEYHFSPAAVGVPPPAGTREVRGFRHFFSCCCRWGKPRPWQQGKRLFGPPSSLPLGGVKTTFLLLLLPRITWAAAVGETTACPPDQQADWPGEKHFSPAIAAKELPSGGCGENSFSPPPSIGKPISRAKGTPAGRNCELHWLSELAKGTFSCLDELGKHVLRHLRCLLGRSTGGAEGNRRAPENGANGFWHPMPHPRYTTGASMSGNILCMLYRTLTTLLARSTCIVWMRGPSGLGPQLSFRVT